MPAFAALRCCLLILSAGWAGAALAGSDSPAARADDAAAADFGALHAFMRKATDADGYLGAVTLIVRDGRIVDFRAYGQRDLARREAMRRDSIFRIYSMSKTVASAAVMLLVEQGRIGVDDPVSRYLPELVDRQVMSGDPAAPRTRAAASEITIRHLLTHTAGFAAGLQGDAAAQAATQRNDPHAAADLRGFVERLSQAPLAADPGTRFGYDGAAIEVLARVVEVVGRQPFDAFLRERIFLPLGMRDTGFSVPASQRGRVVDITTMDDKGRLRIADGPSAREPGAALNAYPSGAGGLYSTACDYARFAQMLLDGGAIAGELGDGRCESMASQDAAKPAKPSFPRMRESSDFRASATKALDSRVRGNDGRGERGELDVSRSEPRRLLRADTVAAMLRNQLTMLDPPVHQYNAGEGFGFGGAVTIDVTKRGQPGSLGRFGWPGAASTTYAIDPAQHLLAIALLQHLPRGDGGKDLPRISRDFYRLVDDALKQPYTPNADTTQ
ncbi:serine hydrolase domain-containing protein [Pseudomonas sp. CGJS7]|uniref:serine hydrolase domain-containing protein n=1 Tax=Pseudomonas sp. CGJS7 TaxID=3109348 RepID=UPI00300815E1